MRKNFSLTFLLSCAIYCHAQQRSGRSLYSSVGGWLDELSVEEPTTLPKITKDDWKALLEAWQEVESRSKAPIAATTSDPRPEATAAPPQTLTVPALIPIQLPAMFAAAVKAETMMPSREKPKAESKLKPQPIAKAMEMQVPQVPSDPLVSFLNFWSPQVSEPISIVPNAGLTKSRAPKKGKAAKS